MDHTLAARHAAAAAADGDEPLSTGIASLPNELWLRIMGFLHGADVRRLAQTCRYFRMYVVQACLQRLPVALSSIDASRWMAWVAAGAALQYGIAYKPANMGWREAYVLPDTVDACQHLSTISAEVLAAKQSKLTALRVADPDPCVTCDRCRVRLPDLWLCMTAGCDHIGCGRRKRGAHALKHAERHEHPIVFKLHSLDMWCYECEKWLGNDGDPAIECLRVKEIAETLAEPAGRTEEEVALFDRRQRERAVSTRVMHSDEFYLIQADWRNLWYDFTMGDRIAPPPSLGDAQVQLATRIERSDPVLLNHDYYVINRQAWEFLAQVYGPAQSLNEHELRNVAVRQVLVSLRRILPNE